MSQRSREGVYDALGSSASGVFPGYGEDAPLDLAQLTSREERQLRDLITSGTFDAWSEAVARVGNCAHPIRLVGASQTVDTRTGEVTGTYSSAREPLGVTFVRCGNRRAEVCPSCSRLYAADTYHLIRAGVVGGKTVPETVAENPLVFATLTAPSFGLVHGRRGTGPCRRAGTGSLCPHGRRAGCPARHDEDDPQLGQPLCADCYDHASHIVWQWWAPTMWRRFTIALRRLVAQHLGVPDTRLGELATVQYAKVAENQRRGAIHFHALVRLDGPRTPDGFAPAPPGLDAPTLTALVAGAVDQVRLTVPGVDDQDPARVLVFGRQLDVRSVTATRRTDDPDRGLSPGQVAGYLAKYATKSIESATAENPHYDRLRATVRTLAARARAVTPPDATEDAAPYALLGKWEHMLGFRGHFASKSRRYSITYRALRRARRRAQALLAQHRADGTTVDLAALEADLLADDAEETTLVIGSWTYAGTGWANEAQTKLANAAAARAREYDQWRAERKRQRLNQPTREGETWKASY